MKMRRYIQYEAQRERERAEQDEPERALPPSDILGTFQAKQVELRVRMTQRGDEGKRGAVDAQSEKDL